MSFEAGAPYFGTLEVGVRQPGTVEARVCEVLASEVATVQIVEVEVSSAQVMSLMTGRGIKLRKSNSGCKWITRFYFASTAYVEACSAHDGVSEVGICQGRSKEGRVCEIGGFEVGACQCGSVKIRICEVCMSEIRAR